MSDLITAVILAGGQGKRLGGLAKESLNIGELSLLDIRIGTFRRLCAEIVLVVNRWDFTAPRGVRVVYDIRRGEGPLMGLYSGLLASTTQLNFVTGVDMPFLQPELFREMLLIAGEKENFYDVTVPCIDNQYEPLFAFYTKSCLPAIKSKLENRHNSQQRLVSFYPQVRVRCVTEAEIMPHDASGLSFFNINTRADLHEARNLQIKKQLTSSEVVGAKP